ncbi:hypothetical protein ACLB2K_010100 [Fragaria x ananassa]
MRVVSSVSFSILINGKQSQFFKPTRGLRQGDPLSPYLFLIVGEVLSKSITAAISSKNLQQIKLSMSCPGLSHLLFADDSLFFLKATAANCTSLRAILDSYCKASGQSVNLEKSSIFFSACTPLHLKELIASTLNIPISEKPGVYLGLPTLSGNSKKIVLAYIRERIKKKLEGWKANVLSQAGREVLIKAVAMAVPSYPMSIFLLPVTLCKALNSDISNFWWGFSDSKDKLHWKAWDSLCKSKLEGGFGFKDLRTVNKVLLTKQCWRLINRPNSLWGKVMKARYFPNTTFLKAKKGSRPSWVWNSLLTGRETITEHALWQINSGRNVDVWSDRWVPNSNRGLIKPIITCNRFTALSVSEVIDEDRNWNISHIEPFLEESDILTIKTIPIGSATDDDLLVWPHSKSGNYSVKSGYHKLFASQGNSCTGKPSSSHFFDIRIWKLIWRPNMAPKVANFMWRALSNALPSLWSLFRRKIVKTLICAICGDQPETIEHCLLHCPWTLAVWFGCSLGYTPDRGKISHLEEWLLEIHKNAPMFPCEKEDVLNFVCLHMWEIWKHRCSVIMKNGSPNPCLVIENIKRGWLNWEEARVSVLQSSQSISRAPTLWTPPPVDVVKINFDGAWKESNLNSGVGVIIRSHMGFSIAGASLFRSHNSAVDAEAEALLYGLRMAVVLKLEKIIVEGDCQEVIKALSDSSSSPSWRISPILKKVAHLVPFFRSIHWNWVPREANRPANAAAKLAIQSLCSQEWANMPPNSLISVLRNDGLPAPP